MLPLQLPSRLNPLGTGGRHPNENVHEESQREKN